MSDKVSNVLPVSDLASKYVVSVEATATLRTVVEHLIEGGVGFVVVKDSGSVAGVVSEHDVVRALHDGADVDEIWAADIMSTDIVAVGSSDSIGDVARVMVDARVRHVLVQGANGGVVSIRDLLDALVSPSESQAPGSDAGPDPASLAVLAPHIEFHLRAAIELGAADRPIEAVTETALALTMFHLGVSGEVGSDAGLPAPAPLTAAKREEIVRRTRALALQLQAHYVSEGQHALAEAYESLGADAYAVLRGILPPARPGEPPTATERSRTDQS